MIASGSVLAEDGGESVGEPEKEPGWAKLSELPSDPEVDRWIRNAGQARERKDWVSFLTTCQQVLESGRVSFSRSSQGTKTSARQQVLEWLTALPPDARRSYEIQFNAKAESLFRKALSEGDVDLIAHIARVYPVTHVGQNAAGYLGALLLDRGMPGLAATTLLELSNRPDLPGKQMPIVLAKLLVAARQSGAEGLVSSTRQRLDELPAGNPLKLGNESIRPQDFYQRFVLQWGEKPVAGSKGYSSFPGSTSSSERKSAAMPYPAPLWFVPIFRNEKFDSEKWHKVTVARPRYTRRLIPSLYPIAVSGKIVLKTFDGIMALDGRTGRILWRASAIDRRLGEFIERLLSVETKDTRLQAQAISNAYQAALSHAFEDTVQFTLAVGGGRIYSVDTVYPGEEAFEARRIPGPAPWVNQQIPMKNSLRAFELEGGKLVWEINGVARASDESTLAEEDLFLGAPVFAEESLLVLVDRISTVYLLFLDPATGEKLGEIPLCMTSKPARSVHYRIKDACPITVVGGIAYCSTQVGRFFAIDLVSRTVIWRFEYEHTLTDQKIGNRNYYASGAVRRQPVSAPAVWGGRLLFVPSDSPRAFCLDRITGSKIWDTPIRPGSFLAGIRRGRAVIAGRKIIALDVEDGKLLWERVAGEPVGRGWLGAKTYLAPVADGLAQMNLETGAIESLTEFSWFEMSSDTAPGIPELGNIVVTPHNILISGPLGVSAFPIAGEELAGIQNEFSSKGKSRQLILRRALVNLSVGKPLTAMADLKTLLAESKKPSDGESCRSLLIKVLLSRAIVTEEDSAKHLKAAEALANSDDEKAALFDAMRRVHLRAGRLLPAFEAARQFAALMTDRPVRDEETPGLYVRADRWLAGWLLDRWKEASEKERAALSTEIARLRSEVDETADSLRRFLNVYGEIPPAAPVWLEFAARLAKGDAWTEAELICLRLTNSQDSIVAAEAAWLRAQICERHGFSEDAFWICRNLLKRFGESEIPAMQSIRSRASEFVKKHPESRLSQKMPMSIPERLELKKETFKKRRYSSPRPIDILSTALPFQREFSIQRGHGSSLLFQRGEDEWSLTLERSQMSYEAGRVSFNGYSARHVYPLAHLFFVAEQRSLICASPAQKKVQWSLGPKDDWQTWFSSEFHDSVGVRPFTQDRGVASTFVGGPHYYRNAGLFHVDPRCIVLNDANTLSALDPMNGKLLWTRFLEMPNYSAMTFTHDSLYEHHRRSQLKIYRLLDGKLVGEHPLIDFINYKGMFIRGGYLGANIDDETLTVKKLDPLTGKDIWSHPTPTGCRFLHPTPGEFGMLYPSGEVHFISLTDGSETFRGKFKAPVKPWTSASAWSRGTSVYLLLGAGTNAGQSRIRARQIHFNQPIRFDVKGSLHCFDRESGTHRWQRDLTQPEGKWFLWNTSKANSPFLFLVRDVRKEVEQNGKTTQRIAGYQLLILSARTGKAVLDRELASNERPLFITESEGSVYIHVPGGRLVATYGK